MRLPLMLLQEYREIYGRSVFKTLKNAPQAPRNEQWMTTPSFLTKKRLQFDTLELPEASSNSEGGTSTKASVPEDTKVSTEVHPTSSTLATVDSLQPGPLSPVLSPTPPPSRPATSSSPQHPLTIGPPPLVRIGVAGSHSSREHSPAIEVPAGKKSTTVAPKPAAPGPPKELPGVRLLNCFLGSISHHPLRRPDHIVPTASHSQTGV